MTQWKSPWRYDGPWYGNDVQRVRFERGAKRHFPTLTGVTRTSGAKAGRSYKVVIAIPFYEPRHVEILFPKHTPSGPKSPLMARQTHPSGMTCISFASGTRATQMSTGGY
jgi:hypothetical protein